MALVAETEGSRSEVLRLAAALHCDAPAASSDRRPRHPAGEPAREASALTAVNLPAAFDAVRTAAPGTGIVVGGRGVDDRVATSWDVVLCRHIAEAVEQVDGLVKRARHN